MLKSLFLRFVLFSAFSFAVCAGSGFFSSPRYNVSTTDEETVSALTETVGAEMTPSPDFSFSRGETYQGFLFRRSLMHGLPVTAQPMSMFEQSLEVGWPLAVVRGVVHQNGPERHTHGAMLFGSKIEPPYDKMLPYQPVWPGILLWGLLGAATAFIPKKK